MEEQDLNSSPSRSSRIINSQMYRLYFKGLVSQENTREMLAGYGVAICDQKDNLLFQMKVPIHCSGITVLEAELKALEQGLKAAVDSGINHITMYCDDHQTYELVSGVLAPKKDNVALLMANVQRIRQQLTSSNLVLVTRNLIKFAYELAKETIVYEIRILMDPLRKAMNETCNICFDDDIKADHMFSVALCGHQFCRECMNKHIQARLFEGLVPNCPHYECDTKLTFSACDNLLTHKLRAMWQRRTAEELIPFADRVYCPNPKCSALMSRTGLSKSTEDGVKRCCVKCNEPFCLNCNVQWHNKLSCDDYKKLGPNPTAYDIKLKALANQKRWRQCGKCRYMIELSEGCIDVTCRCGNSFCYTCGEEWKEGGCTHRQVYNEEFERASRICRGCCACFLSSILCVPLILLVYYLK